MKAPKGGHRRLPHFGKAVEEGKNTKGMNPRQETVPRLPSGVAECGKHKQRKVGGLEAPQSSLEASKSRLEAPKSRPGGSKIELWGLQNPAQSLPRHHFYTTFKLRRLKMTTMVEVLKPIWPTWLQLGGPRPSKLEAQTRKNGC